MRYKKKAQPCFGKFWWVPKAPMETAGTVSRVEVTTEASVSEAFWESIASSSAVAISTDHPTVHFPADPRGAASAAPTSIGGCSDALCAATLKGDAGTGGLHGARRGFLSEGLVQPTLSAAKAARVEAAKAADAARARAAAAAVKEKARKLPFLQKPAADAVDAETAAAGEMAAHAFAPPKTHASRPSDEHLVNREQVWQVEREEKLETLRRQLGLPEARATARSVSAPLSLALDGLKTRTGGSPDVSSNAVDNVVALRAAAQDAMVVGRAETAEMLLGEALSTFGDALLAAGAVDGASGATSGAAQRGTLMGTCGACQAGTLVGQVAAGRGRASAAAPSTPSPKDARSATSPRASPPLGSLGDTPNRDSNPRPLSLRVEPPYPHTGGRTRKNLTALIVSLLCERSAARRQLHRPSAALADALAAVKLAPRSAPAHIGYALALEASMRYADAVHALEIAISLDPTPGEEKPSNEDKPSHLSEKPSHLSDKPSHLSETPSRLSETPSHGDTPSHNSSHTDAAAQLKRLRQLVVEQKRREEERREETRWEEGGVDTGMGGLYTGMGGLSGMGGFSNLGGGSDEPREVLVPQKLELDTPWDPEAFARKKKELAKPRHLERGLY